MTDDTDTAVDMENLDKFEEAFYDKKSESNVETDTEDNALAPEEDKDAPEEGDEDSPEEEASPENSEDSDETGEEPEEEAPEEEEKEPEEEPKEKNKKPSAQERINAITKKFREAERANQMLLQRLEALETRDRQPDPKPATVRDVLPQGAPQPDAVDENGDPLYLLGEFDPNYIFALTQFGIEQEKIHMREEAQRNAEAQMLAAAQNELKTSWAEKLENAEEDIPDLRENIAELVDSFEGIDPNYGEYLAGTIMQCENGPAIMDYLSRNIGEAQKIVASGPAAATLAIGRLEAKFTKDPSEDKRNTKKVSSAPPIPETNTRGRKGHSPIRADTDNLDAFEEVFYVKK